MAGGEVLHGGVHVERRFDLVEHAAGALANSVEIDAAQEFGEFTQAKIFSDGEIRAEGEFLVNHGDAEAARGQGVGGTNDLAVEKDGAGIRSVNTRQDFAEGR